jgi:hypothetical protein
MLEGCRIIPVEDDEIMGASRLRRMQIEEADGLWHRQITRALPAIRLPEGTDEDLCGTRTRTSHPPAFPFGSARA